MMKLEFIQMEIHKTGSQQAFTCSKSTIETVHERAKYAKLTIKRSERDQLRLSGVFIVNFEYISHLALVFLLFSLSMQRTCELSKLCVNFFIFQQFLDLMVSSFIHLQKGFPKKQNITTKWNAQGADLKQWNGKCISIIFL